MESKTMIDYKAKATAYDIVMGGGKQMREILFRGKRVDGELWVEGSLVNNIFFRAESNRPIPYIIDPHEYESYDCMEDIGELAVEVIPKTVGQFTGLTDKNGKKIFEGDVLSYEDVAGVKDGIGNVLFGLFYGAWIVYVDDYEENPLSYVAYSCEVIGNIHDNKELLQ